MKVPYSYFICAAAMQIFAPGFCSAQTLELKPAPTGITIDGNCKEWGDKMTYTDEKAKVDYTLSNDKDNLYLVVKTKDPVQQSSILGAGITFTIDTKGRKKSSYQVTFPASAADKDQSRYIGLSPDQMQTSVMFANKYGKIGIDGFKDISDEQLSTENSFDIKVAVGYDAAGYMVYEEAIPLTLFHAGDLLTKEWAFNIKLNPVQGKEKEVKSSIAQVPNSKRSVDKFKKDEGRDAFSQQGTLALIDLTPKIDFWGKFTLAKAQ
jgi:hypothetical protein